VDAGSRESDAGIVAPPATVLAAAAATAAVAGAVAVGDGDGDGDGARASLLFASSEMRRFLAGAALPSAPADTGSREEATASEKGTSASPLEVSSFGRNAGASSTAAAAPPDGLRPPRTA